MDQHRTKLIDDFHFARIASGRHAGDIYEELTEVPFLPDLFARQGDLVMLLVDMLIAKGEVGLTNGPNGRLD